MKALALALFLVPFSSQAKPSCSAYLDTWAKLSGLDIADREPRLALELWGAARRIDANASELRPIELLRPGLLRALSERKGERLVIYANSIGKVIAYREEGGGRQKESWCSQLLPEKP